MDKWVHEKLSACLDFPVPDDLVQYILAIDNGRDLEEYLKTLLDFENSQHRNFVSELLQRKGIKQQNQNNENNTGKSKKKFKALSLGSDVPVEKNEKSKPEDPSAGKKKPKFVNLYSQEGQNREIVLLKGRHHCDCQASKHKLINNCLNCGRIICQQEGSGPCLCCGTLVCSPDEQNVLNSSSGKSATLYNKLMDLKRPKGWEAALAQRNRLLEYDRTSERRTRVTDDDSDYFNSGSVWLSKQERAKLEKYQQSLKDKKHASRLHQTFTLDFAGRQIIEEQNFVEVDENIVNDITKSSGNSSRDKNWSLSDQKINKDDFDIHPGYIGPPPMFDSSVKSEYDGRILQKHIIEGIQRVQDAPLQEIGDKAVCLSMHQPWASLLIAGIKMHEGRSWYTSHRGRLWIASTVQPPDNETIKTMENMYNVLYPDKTLIFPKHYSTGCLLGCVTVDDCLAQEEYQQIYPGGESESPYVFICSNPMELKLKFPIKGKHKIYSLEPKIHQAAMKSLQKMIKIEARV
ncbi:activating signal cointegrator 1 [Arctopsyche grandis]|uniref:activating signal cointegrator 1 n=1 Tax=Arctopsyche grandis TaxID=121162 RepID=UPI00406D6412